MKCNDNKKEIGKFKDETDSIPIREFVGLRPKLYSIQVASCPVNVTDFKCQLCVSPGDVKCHKFATKGVKKAIAENELLHRKFITCLNEKQKLKVTAKHFRSTAHEVKQLMKLRWPYPVLMISVTF